MTKVLFVCNRMEDKKGGGRVSQIANIFQQGASTTGNLNSGMGPARLDEGSAAESPGGTSPTVTVVRTESHLARFNNARALFEKLGSLGKWKCAFIFFLFG